MPYFRIVPFALSILAGLTFATPLSAQDDFNPEECEAMRADAQAGVVDQQLELAICLFYSDNEKERKEALGWGIKAMEAGNMEAKNLVAVAYIHGVGVAADAKRGQALMEEAAVQGSFGAQLSLAEQYIKGGGFYKRDAAKGLQLLTSAAKGGGLKGVSLGHVQWRIGMMHLQGVGTQKDEKEAFRWVSMGAANDSSNALISRAVMFATGEGVEENDGAARISYQRAMDNKDGQLKHAMRGLGSMLYFGEGGQVDRIQGCAYLMIANGLGDKNAKIIFEQIQPDLSEADQSACKQAAMKWTKANLGDN